MRNCELLVVGAGAAGINAAVAAWEAGCRSVILADRAAEPGGILRQCRHEGFGRLDSGSELTGPEYAALLADKLKRSGVVFLPDTDVLSISENKTAVCSGKGRVEKISFERIILATGCREKSIGSLLVAGTRPAGIFTAGQAQELINLRHLDPGSEVLILGSGDLGMIMARRFTLEGSRVIAVLEQEAHYGGMARNFHRCIEAFSIPLRCRMKIKQIHGEGRICGVTAEHLDSGEKEFIACDTLVTALGLIPERELSRGIEDKDWLYFAGNCSRVHDIVDSAAAEGERTGIMAGKGLYV